MKFVLSGSFCELTQLSKLAVTADQVVRQSGGLTQAEAEIAALVAGGQTAAKIASFRRVSLHTVRSQIKSIYFKTDVSSQAQLTRLVKALPATRDRQGRSRTPFLS